MDLKTSREFCEGMAYFTLVLKLLIENGVELCWQLVEKFPDIDGLIAVHQVSRAELENPYPLVHFAVMIYNLPLLLMIHLTNWPTIKTMEG